MAGLTEFYYGSNEPSHASQFKWLEYTFKTTRQYRTLIYSAQSSAQQKIIKT